MSQTCRTAWWFYSPQPEALLRFVTGKQQKSRVLLAPEAFNT